MTNKPKQSLEQKQDAPELSAEQVTTWLSGNPDFFDQHRAVLSELNLPSDAGTAISLHQYQVRIMREQRREVDAKLALLVKNAKTNHKINQDLLSLAATLIKFGITELSADSTAKYTASICQHFKLSAARIIDVEANPLLESLHRALQNNECLCENKIDTALTKYLFATEQKNIASYAIVPLQKEAALSALLVLGSDDADRFKPNMGNEFLKQLGTIVAAVI